MSADVIPDTSQFDYIAFMFYATACHQKGEIPVRWLCLNDKLRAEYLDKAKSKYIYWAHEEIEALERRKKT